MNNNDKKAPSKSWLQKLFKQPSSSAEIQGKHYFAHRYHDEGRAQPQTPFHTLFSGNATETDAQPNPCTLFPEDSPFLSSVYSGNVLIPHLNQIHSNYHQLGENVNAPFTVLNCYDETPDTKTFRLGRLNNLIFNYLPGQYITLSVAISGKEYKRSYSLASVPSDSGIIDITVKRDPNGGVVSNWLNNQLKPGGNIRLKGPYGKFTCATNTSPKILFLAAGSGVVPIMSMLRWLTRSEAKTDMIVLLSFKALPDIIYRNELDLIAARHSNVKLFITLTQESPLLNRWQGFTGRIDKNRIAALVPDIPERTVYSCGPDAFMAKCKQALLDLKLPPEQFLCESFSVDSTLASTQAGDGQTITRKTGHYQVKFALSRKTVNTNGTVNLLDLAEKSGITLTHECRSGECGECMVKCLKGKVEMTQEAEISEFDRKQGWVYACCAYPVSNTVLDA